MDVDALRSYLEASGYEVRFRHEGWVECLLLQGPESFVGRGVDERVALAAAIDAAFPSQLAKRLLVEAVAARGTTAAPEPPRAAVGHKAAPRPGAPPLVSREHRPERTDLSRAIDELRVLSDRVRDSRDELGLCTAERQRLAILAWICEARAHTDVFPTDSSIRDQVAVVSRQLTEIGKAFWPGSVTALQLSMEPRDLPKHMLGGFASTWTRASELAERALHSLEHADERRGHDEHGWADLDFTRPSPADPEGTLKALVEEIERIGGSIERYAEARDPNARPTPDQFTRWVRTVRWLRGTHVDPERWARVVGRLRWWAGRRDPKLAALAKELDGGYVPSRPWSELVEGARAEAPLAPPDSLVDQARGRCAGKRIVVVSHRRDPDLRGRLDEVLEAASLEWTVAEPKRLEALGDQIHGKSFDLVLGALGLQAPAPDRFLAGRLQALRHAVPPREPGPSDRLPPRAVAHGVIGVVDASRRARLA